MDIEHNTITSLTDEKENVKNPVLANWAILFVVTTLTIIIDQLSKLIIVNTLDYQESWAPIAALKDIFDITYTRNTGAAFGMAQDFSSFFLIVAVVVSVVIIFYYRRIPPGNFFIRFALGLEMGGTLGNAIDRITRGYVVDFLHLHGWPVFNIANSSIVVGVGLLVVLLWWQDYQEAKQNKGKQNTGVASDDVRS